jgi:hypothetical protein
MSILDKPFEKFLFAAPIAIAFALVSLPAGRYAFANGTTDFEGTRCVFAALELGNYVTTCVDVELPDCQPPGWFPTGPTAASSDEMNSYSLSDSVRYNEADYSVGSYTRWEHDWYSRIDVPYGPALPSYGHVWDEYNGSALVKSVSCDEHGTVSYP